MEEAIAFLKEEVSARDQHTNRMMVRKRELRDLLAKHGKLYQNDMHRASTAPTEGSMVTGLDTVCEIVSTLTSATIK